MDPLRAAFDDYRPQGDTEARDLARAVALVEAGDAWSRDRPLHLTASALVVHPPSRRVLLRWHARMRGWFQVGGHGDPGERDPWAIALREATEETGLTDLTPVDPAGAAGTAGTAGIRTPVQVVVVPVAAGGGEAAHEHVDVRYVLATRRPETIRAEAAETPVRWFTLAEARAAVSEPNLVTLLERVEPALGDPDT